MNILAVALFFSIDSLISFDLYLHSFFVPRQRSLRLTCTLCVYEPRFNLRPFQETTLLVWSLNYLSRIRNTLYFIRNSLIFLYPIPWIFLKQIHSTNSWNIFDNFWSEWFFSRIFLSIPISIKIPSFIIRKSVYFRNYIP